MNYGQAISFRLSHSYAHRNNTPPFYRSHSRLTAWDMVNDLAYRCNDVSKGEARENKATDVESESDTYKL